MSMGSKLAAAKELAQVLKRFPDDAAKIYPSFRQAQIDLYEKSNVTSLPSVEILEARAKAAQDLISDKNNKTFALSDKMYRPDGQPRYYETIMREANRQNSKVGAFAVIKETTFGWLR